MVLPVRRIAGACLLAAGCSTTPAEPATIVLLTGEEADTWTRDPAVQQIELNLVTSAGKTPIGRSTAPATSIEVTAEMYVGDTATFEAVGRDAANEPVVTGLSTPFYVDELRRFSLPLFVGRKGDWSRPSNELEQPRQTPLLALVYQQYLFAAGGDAIAGFDGSIPDVYDFGYWQMLHGQPRLPRVPKSLAAIDTLLLVVDDTGATWIDVSTDGSSEATAPAGLTFGEIAGGATVKARDGGFFIVGATRTTGEPSSKILKVAADGLMETLTLSTARLGAAACAGLTDEPTLVVAGGSSTGAGIEILRGQALVPLAYPPDATVGMALAPIDAGAVALLGGTDPTTGAVAPSRRADLGCVQACATEAWGADPVPLRQATAFRIGDGSLLAIGASDQAETLAYAISGSPPVVRALPLREPREGASAVELFTGQIALVGGTRLADRSPAQHLEIFTP